MSLPQDLPSIQGESGSNGFKDRDALQQEIDRLQAELSAARREGEERLRNVLEHTQDGYIALDHDYRVTYVNRRVGEMRNEDTSTWVGKTIWETTPRMIGTEYETAYRKALEERVPVIIQRPGLYTERTYEIRINPTPEGLAIFLSDRTEEVRAEQALRESESKFMAIFTHTPFAITLVDEEKRIADVNDAWLTLFGYEREEVLGKTALELGIVEDLEQREAVFAMIQQGESAQNRELRYRTKTGKRIYLSGSAQQVTLGGKSYLLAAIEDISGRKEVEDALRELAAKERERAAELRAVMDAVPAILWITNDPECESISGNSYAYERAQMSPDADFSLTHPSGKAAAALRAVRDGKDLSIPELPMQRAAKTGQPVRDCEFDLLLADGETVSLFGNAVPLLNEKGEVTGAVGAFMDITERRRVEEALKRSEERFQQIVTVSPDTIFIQTHGCFAFINPIGVEMLGGKKLEDILGRPVLDFVHEKDRDRVARRIRRLNEERRSVPLLEETFVRLDGSVFDAEAIGVPFRYEGENGALVILRDVSERKQSERLIQQQHEVTEAINHVLTQAIHSKTEEELGKTCLAVAEALTGSRFGFIDEIGPDGRLHDIAISNPGWSACNMTYDPSGHRQPLGSFPIDGLHGRVIGEGKSLIANDPAQHPDAMGTPEGHPPLTAFLGVPLKDAGRVIGLIAMGNREGGYSQVEQFALEALAPAIVEALKRVRSEIALRESEERFRLSSRAVQGMLYDLYPKRNLVFHSEGMERLTGFKPGEEKGSPAWWTTRIHPEDSWVHADLEAAYTNGRESLAYEYRIQHKDGHWVYVEDHAYLVRDETGTVVRVVGIVTDITERKRAEQALKESEERFRSVLESSLDAAYRRDLRTEQYDYLSPVIERVMGIPLDQMAAMTTEEVINRMHPEDVAGVQEKLSQSVEQGSGLVEYRFRGNDEQYRWLGDSFSITLDEQGQPIYRTGIVHDISERKRADQALRESEERFRIMADGTTLLIWVTNAGGSIEFINQAYKEFFGVVLDDVKGTGWQPLVHTEDHPRYVASFMAANESQVPFVSQARVLRHDGQWRWVESHGQPRFSKAGEYLGMAGSSLDITERKQAEEALLRSSQKISEILSSIKDDFYVLDRDWKFVYANKQFTGKVGKEPEDFIGNVIWEMFPKHVGSILYENFHASMEKGQIRRFEVGGHYTDAIYSMTSFPSAEGITVLGSDITERVRAEEALRESEEHYRVLFETMQQGVVYQKADGTIISMNPAAVRILGKTPEEFLGETSVTVDHDTLREDGTPFPGMEHPAMVSLATGEEVRDVLMQVWNPRQERYRLINITAVPLFRPGETTPYQEYTIFEDVTERHETLHALRESEEQFQIALRNSPVVVMTHDTDLRYVWIHNAKHLPDTTKIVGLKDEEIQPYEDVKELIEFKKRVLESGVGARKEVHARFYGKPLVFDMTAEPLRDERGEVIGLTVAAVDLTEQRTLEVEVQQSADYIEIQRQLIRQREKERVRIARDIHDGPLQELIGTSFGIAEIKGITDDQARQEKLDRLSTSLQDQVAELRAFCGELRPPALAPFGLEKAIRSHVQSLRDRYPYLSFRLDLMQDRRLLPEDTRMALYRVYQEAMNNIVKHARATEINIRFVFDGDKATLEIRDNGQGFEVPLSWVTLARAGHMGMVGMRERIEMVGGLLEVHSQPGGGTLVAVSVPREPGSLVV